MRGGKAHATDISDDGISADSRRCNVDLVTFTFHNRLYEKSCGSPYRMLNHLHVLLK